MKILCPVDLREASLNAINYAGDLAKRIGAPLTLVHVVTEATLIRQEAFASDELLRLEAKAEVLLENICQETHTQFGVPCDYLIEKADLGGGVANIAAHYGYGLIITGTNGANQLDKYVFGTNAMDIIENTRIPVIVVPADHYDTRVDHIVYASNYQEGDHENITQLLNLANSLNASVTILHVSSEDNPTSYEMFEAYRDFIFDKFYYTVPLNIEQIVHKNPVQGIMEFMQKNGGDLLAMLTHHRNFFENTFHKSVTKKFAMIAEYPIMVFHR